MLRTLRRAVLVLIVSAAIVGTALALTARPDLEKARDDATATWKAVRSPLTARYDTLAEANDAVRTVGGAGRDVVEDLGAALDRWHAAASGSPVSEQVAAANDLEGLIRRLSASVAASERLSSDATVTTALSALTDTKIPEAGRAFNDAAGSYAAKRAGPARRVVAGLLGYEAIPALDLGGDPASTL